MSAHPSRGIGDNSGDEFAMRRADIAERVEGFLRAADVWQKRPVFDEAMAERANDFLAGLRKLIKEADEARKAETKPHRDLVKAIDGAWGALIDRAEKTRQFVEPQFDSFKRAKAAKAEADRAEAEARQRKFEAEARLAEAAAANAAGASARIEAEARVEAAQAAAKIAASEAAAAARPIMIASATGLANRSGIKTERRANIVNLGLAFVYFRDRSEVRALILQLANAELRHAPTIRGDKQVPTIPGIEWETST